MSDEQAERILDLEAEVIAVARVLTDIIRDLEAHGHAGMAAHVRTRAEAAAYLVPLAAETLQQVAELEHLRAELQAARESAAYLGRECDGLQAELSDALALAGPRGDDILRERLAELTTAEVLHLSREHLGRASCWWCGAIPTAEESDGHWERCEQHPARKRVQLAEATVEDLQDRLRRADEVLAKHGGYVDDRVRAGLHELLAEPPGMRERVAARLGLHPLPVGTRVRIVGTESDGTGTIARVRDDDGVHYGIDHDQLGKRLDFGWTVVEALDPGGTPA